MCAGQEHLDAAGQADHAPRDGGVVQLHRQSVTLVPVAFDLPPPAGEFKFETLTSAAREDRVPVPVLIEREKMAAVRIRAPAVGPAPGGKGVAATMRLLVELQQGRQGCECQRLLAGARARCEELGTVAFDQTRIEVGADEIGILYEPVEKSEIRDRTRDLELPERLAHSLERRRAIRTPDDKLGDQG